MTTLGYHSPFPVFELRLFYSDYPSPFSTFYQFILLWLLRPIFRLPPSVPAVFGEFSIDAAAFEYVPQRSSMPCYGNKQWHPNMQNHHPPLHELEEEVEENWGDIAILGVPVENTKPLVVGVEAA